MVVSSKRPLERNRMINTNTAEMPSRVSKSTRTISIRSATNFFRSNRKVPSDSFMAEYTAGLFFSCTRNTVTVLTPEGLSFTNSPRKFFRNGSKDAIFMGLNSFSSNSKKGRKAPSLNPYFLAAFLISSITSCFLAGVQNLFHALILCCCEPAVGINSKGPETPAIRLSRFNREMMLE